MNPYIAQLKNELSKYHVSCADGEQISILESLWLYYAASAPVDDGQIRRTEAAMAPVFQELSLAASDLLDDRIGDLITAYQRAAFLEGLQVGTRLAEELNRF